MPIQVSLARILVNMVFVNLTEHMGIVPPGFHFITSQPLVIDNRIIVGGWIYDNESEGEPSGVVPNL